MRVSMSSPSVEGVSGPASFDLAARLERTDGFARSGLAARLRLELSAEVAMQL